MAYNLDPVFNKAPILKASEIPADQSNNSRDGSGSMTTIFQCDVPEGVSIHKIEFCATDSTSEGYLSLFVKTTERETPFLLQHVAVFSVDLSNEPSPSTGPWSSVYQLGQPIVLPQGYQLRACKSTHVGSAISVVVHGWSRAD